MWMILNNREPTWDILQKITFIGLGLVKLMSESRRKKCTYNYDLPFYKGSGEDDRVPKCMGR